MWKVGEQTSNSNLVCLSSKAVEVEEVREFHLRTPDSEQACSNRAGVILELCVAAVFGRCADVTLEAH